ncbi:uncharacterized protein HD556DRAFT_1330743 [Suillus plorans]|uniref:Uncharacterized protein n=1 Tax=Suillus plorans TaxID=116603 RepID=A0A9P7J5C7_9AGAM|nr:uncharacterized protein HD556DRAFT_1330743 [Suillus plorans]KAG1803871.1 hypothetical protein HD556DRAFT_1330743 [Suillus plorans]
MLSITSCCVVAIASCCVVLYGDLGVMTLLSRLHWQNWRCSHQRVRVFSLYNQIRRTNGVNLSMIARKSNSESILSTECTNLRITVLASSKSYTVQNGSDSSTPCQSKLTFTFLSALHLLPSYNDRLGGPSICISTRQAYIQTSSIRNGPVE